MESSCIAPLWPSGHNGVFFGLFSQIESHLRNFEWQEWPNYRSKSGSFLNSANVQSVGDEAKSLVKHVKSGLGAHHSPDTFHIQQELTKAGSAQLKLKIKRETETLEKFKISTERLKEKKSGA